MSKPAPELSLETVMEELKVPLLLDGRLPERAYLALAKHDQQVYLGADSEDIEPQLGSLMSDAWVPLGFVAYYRDNPNPVTHPLNWYADLVKRDESRYGRVYRIVSARLEEAARRLTNELSERHLIQRAQ